MAIQLSRGAIPLLYSDQRQSDGRYQPVLQVIDMEEHPQPGGRRLHFLVLSDGEQYTASMLTPSAEVCMEGSNPVALHSLVQLVTWLTEERSGKLLVFVREIRHLNRMSGQIGDPASFDPQPQPDVAADRFSNGVATGMGQGARSDAELGRFLTTQPSPPAPASGVPAPIASNPYSANPYAQQGAMQQTAMQQSTMSFQAAPHAQPQLHQPQQQQLHQPQQQQQQQQQQQHQPQQQQQHQQQHQQQQQQQQRQPHHVQQSAITAPSGPHAGPSAHSAGYGGVARTAPTAPPAPWHHQASASAAPASEPPAPHLQHSAGSSGFLGQHQAAAPRRSPATGRQFDGRPAGGSSMGAPAPPITVAALSPYCQRWMLKARITKKNTVRKFNYKQKEGEGQLFSIDLLDSEGGETRATFFGGAVDMFYEMLQERKTYNFSGGRVKQADKRWCRCEHEITFDEHTVITPVEDTADCPKMAFDFKPLSSLEGLQVGTMVDVAAVVIEVEPASEVNLKAGGSKMRMNVVLMDDSAATCRLTLWGEQIDKPWSDGVVALLKNLKVGDFGGVSLSASFGTIFFIGQEAVSEGHPRAQELTSWFAQSGNGARGTAKSLSNSPGSGKPSQSIAEMKAEDAGLDPPGGSLVTLYHTISPATVTFLPHDRPPFYFSCVQEIPDERATSEGQNKTRMCMKKTERNMDGSWCCGLDHRCTEARARWVSNFSVADESGSQMVSAFDETGKDIMGVDATEAARLWDVKDMDPAAEERFEKLFKDAQFKRWRMRLRSKKEIWNDEERVKVSIVECRKLNYMTESRRMLEEVLTACGERPSNQNGTVAAPACGG